MAVIRKSGRHHNKAPASKKLLSYLQSGVLRVLNFLEPSNLKDFVLNPSRISWILALGLILAEVFVNIVVIHGVKYTEIDWIAYMQEVEGVVKNRTLDYSLLKGDTGPLVYPAGFVWFYAILYYLTDYGANVRLAQYFFAVIYLSIISLVFRLLIKSRKVPNLVMIIIAGTSYRIHSICVLRLFNDPVAMLFLYAAINAFVDNKWSLGSVMYSIAVSIKMNILLFAPALFLAYIATQGIKGTIKQLTICASIQILSAIPFLLTHPVNYMIGAFNLGRVFLFKWTVNWRFVPEDIFVSKQFHLGLLALHLLLLALMSKRWWSMLQAYAKSPKRNVHLLLLPLFMCNFIGIACARSLHYQFYIWYYHQLHFLSWNSSPKWDTLRLLVLGVIELCWNTYPSTDLSSGMLHAAHVVLLLGLVVNFRKKTE